ncbi:MAG: DNA polymerase III subunit delta' [Oscillatoriaceae bacterium SKW80]|nr:DNA polymerase III subunit delta' [Oscillatoriaceae bacterium SKYG93]MCX8122359.1 DNA polymerase III subunit delta' [Oscillatoriaceae bacterium SKW80]MDW8452467.1 DNA polymerase III subunit delta' [Oscillatoriaceae cyanobacterium SKYGB_i_bin93]HIK27746.1 DNA polymerase III subunit delta' [Oscillatoriaceae cyanobacterium M7585_C2015_266]
MSDPFSRVIGQNQAVELLKRAVERDRVAPAYLFVGANGIGRSLTARCFIELLFSINLAETKAALLPSRIAQKNHPDLLWVEPTYQHQGKLLSAKEVVEAGVKRKALPQIRLEQVREIQRFLSRPPLEAPRAFVVLEHAETMAEAAANALLKTLEEPKQATLILIAPSPDSLLPTLVSRCQRIPFYPLNDVELQQVLHQLGHADILQNKLLLSLAQGSPGEAIALVEQFHAIPSSLIEAVVELLLPSKEKRSLSLPLELSKQIDATLDLQAQLWLLNYMQHYFWQNSKFSINSTSILKILEKSRNYLLSYAQPRLVWEVTLLQLMRI